MYVCVTSNLWPVSMGRESDYIYIYINKKYSLLIRLRWIDIWFHVPRISSIQVNLHQFKDTNSCPAPPSTHNRHLHASPQMIYTPFYRLSNDKSPLLTFSLIRNKDFIWSLQVGLFLLFLPSLSLFLFPSPGGEDSGSPQVNCRWPWFIGAIHAIREVEQKTSLLHVCQYIQNNRRFPTGFYH